MRNFILAFLLLLLVVAVGVRYFTAAPGVSKPVPVAENGATVGKPAPEQVAKDSDTNASGVRQEVKESVPSNAAPEKPKLDPVAETGVTVGKLAPEFVLKDLDGNPTSIRQEGKVTVINFWATWCPPCREEMPELQQFAVQSRPGVGFYAVNIQEPAAKVAGFLNQNKYTMPVLLDSDGAVATAFRINAIPTTLIIDKSGIIRFRKTGGVTKAELENVLKGL